MDVKRLLIIEDLPNDIKYYKELFSPDREISFLFVSSDKDFTETKLRELVELLYDEVSQNIKDYFICAKEELLAFLKDRNFDFYIIDSLNGFAGSLVAKAGLSKERVAFLSSTESFRESMQDKGYVAYRKNFINDLIKDCL